MEEQKQKKGQASGHIGRLMMFLLVPGALISFIVSIFSLSSCTANYSLGCSFGLFFEWVIFGFELAITFVLLLISLKNKEKPIHRELWKVELGVFIVLLIALGFSLYPEFARMLS